MWTRFEVAVRISLEQPSAPLHRFWLTLLLLRGSWWTRRRRRRGGRRLGVLARLRRLPSFARIRGRGGLASVRWPLLRGDRSRLARPGARVLRRRRRPWWRLWPRRRSLHSLGQPRRLSLRLLLRIAGCRGPCCFSPDRT